MVGKIFLLHVVHQRLCGLRIILSAVQWSQHGLSFFQHHDGCSFQTLVLWQHHIDPLSHVPTHHLTIFDYVLAVTQHPVLATAIHVSCLLFHRFLLFGLN